MKLLNLDDTILMDISSLKRNGNELIIKGQILGSMPITAKLSPEQARAIFRLLDFKTLVFLVSMIFRRNRRKKL